MDLPASGVIAFVFALVLLHAVVEATQGRRGRLIAVWVPVWMAGMAVWRVLVPPMALPIDLLVPLHEGTSALSVKLLDMTSAHAGRRWMEVAHGYAWSHRADMRDAVHLDLGLTVLLVFWFGALVLRTTRSWGWTIGSVLVLLTSPLLWMAALSETPAVLIAVCAVQGALAWRTWRASAPWSGAGLAAAVALLGDALLATAMRHEQVLLFVVPVAMVAWDLRGGRRASLVLVHRWGAWVGARLGDVLRRPRGPALLVGLTLLLATCTAVIGGPPNWTVSAFNPFAPRIFSMLVWLVGLLPLALGLGACLGLVGGVRSGARWGLVALSFVALARMYHAAGNYVFFELLRYATLLLGPALVLAVGGVGVLRAGVLRHGVRVPRIAGILGVWVALAPPTTVVADVFARDFSGPSRENPIPGLVSTNKQREARFVFEVADRWSECVLVMPTANERFRANRDTSIGNDVHVRRPGDGVIRSPLEEASLLDWGQRNLGSASCAVVIQSMDCHQPAVRCPPIEGEVLATWTFEDDTWSNENEYGPMPAAITLTAWRLR